jgi:hypothetical protein
MNKLGIRKRGVTNVAFAGTIVVLIVAAGLGFGLYGNALSNPKTVTITNLMTETMNHSVTTNVTEMVTQNSSYMFTPASGVMISNGWLLTAPAGMDNFAVSIHAEGLEVNGTYLVEGTLSSGSMQSVPISSQSMTMNTTAASEFQADKSGTGLFWIELESNPSTTFENIQLYFLQGGSMQNATVVATVTFAMSH